ncbi:MAG: DUF3159 domain-containing protein [Kineosporiaceae bacterium]
MTAPAVEGAPTTVEELVRSQLLRALGGWRGTAEAALPILAFLAVWWWRSEAAGDPGALRQSLLAAGVVMAVLVVTRVAQRQTLQHVLSGVVGLVIAAVLALRTGNASDVFLPGILYNLVLAVLFGASVLLRWPLLGLAYGALVGDVSGWRSRPEVVRLFQRLTAVFVASYALRVVVQLPLYLAGSVTVLGIAKLVLGWPLLALVVVVIGAMLARGRTPIEHPGERPLEP